MSQIVLERRVDENVAGSPCAPSAIVAFFVYRAAAMGIRSAGYAGFFPESTLCCAFCKLAARGCTPRAARRPLRLPFAAPLRIATVGQSCAEIKNALETWRGQVPSIPEGVLKTLHVEEVEHLKLESRVQQVVVGDRDLKTLFRILSRMPRPGEHLPRLVICSRSPWPWPVLKVSELPPALFGVERVT
jgi:hypothetical protein